MAIRKVFFGVALFALVFSAMATAQTAKEGPDCSDKQDGVCPQWCAAGSDYDCCIQNTNYKWINGRGCYSKTPDATPASSQTQSGQNACKFRAPDSAFQCNEKGEFVASNPARWCVCDQDGKVLIYNSVAESMKAKGQPTQQQAPNNPTPAYGGGQGSYGGQGMQPAPNQYQQMQPQQAGAAAFDPFGNKFSDVSQTVSTKDYFAYGGGFGQGSGMLGIGNSVNDLIDAFAGGADVCSSEENIAKVADEAATALAQYGVNPQICDQYKNRCGTVENFCTSGGQMNIDGVNIGCDNVDKAKDACVESVKKRFASDDSAKDLQVQHDWWSTKCDELKANQQKENQNFQQFQAQMEQIRKEAQQESMQRQLDQERQRAQQQMQQPNQPQQWQPQPNQPMQPPQNQPMLGQQQPAPTPGPSDSLVATATAEPTATPAPAAEVTPTATATPPGTVTQAGLPITGYQIAQQVAAEMITQPVQPYVQGQPGQAGQYVQPMQGGAGQGQPYASGSGGGGGMPNQAYPQGQQGQIIVQNPPQPQGGQPNQPQAGGFGPMGGSMPVECRTFASADYVKTELDRIQTGSDAQAAREIEKCGDVVTQLSSACTNQKIQCGLQTAACNKRSGDLVRTCTEQTQLDQLKANTKMRIEGNCAVRKQSPAALQSLTLIQTKLGQGTQAPAVEATVAKVATSTDQATKIQNAYNDQRNDPWQNMRAFIAGNPEWAGLGEQLNAQAQQDREAADALQKMADAQYGSGQTPSEITTAINQLYSQADLLQGNSKDMNQASKDFLSRMLSSFGMAPG